MRVAISAVMDAAKSGAWQVAKNTIKELAKIDPVNNYLIFVEKTYDNDFGDMPDNFRIIRASITAKQPILNILWHGFVLPVLLLVYKAEILYLPWHAAALIFKTRPVVLKILDLTEYRLPDHYSSSRMIYRKMMIPISSRLADRVIALSEYTKDEILRILRIKPQKISINYAAAHERYKQINREEARRFISEKYGIKDPFVLYVGQIQHPNKNLVQLLHAFKNIKADYGVTHKLILGGKKHISADIVFDTIKELELGDQVQYLGYLPDKDLPYFYNSADVFVYPSFYEGFGIPIIEAMACGCPVITSNTSALPEVAGDAAILVDPTSASGIEKAMLQVLSDNEKKENMIKNGLEQAGRFTWNKTARNLLREFESVASK